MPGPATFPSRRLAGTGCRFVLIRGSIAGNLLLMRGAGRLGLRRRLLLCGTGGRGMRRWWRGMRIPAGFAKVAGVRVSGRSSVGSRWISSGVMRWYSVDRGSSARLRNFICFCGFLGPRIKSEGGRIRRVDTRYTTLIVIPALVAGIHWRLVAKCCGCGLPEQARQ